MKTQPRTPYVPKERNKLRLGDAVATVAKPIAKTIDAMTAMLPEKHRTHLEHCPGCVQRQEKLNNLI